MTLPASSIVNHQIFMLRHLHGGVRRSTLRMPVMKKILIAMLVLSTPAPALAVEEEFCAMVIAVPDEGYVTMRMGPGEQFGVQTKLVRNDFLYADTFQCLSWGDICTKSWTHVFSVHRMDGAPRDNRHGYTAGWIYTNYIKSVPCDWDWGYPDPDPPKNIDPS
jgi:hypothetical protein